MRKVKNHELGPAWELKSNAVTDHDYSLGKSKSLKSSVSKLAIVLI